VWEKKNRRRVLLRALCQIGKAVGSRRVYVYCVSPKHFHSSVMESERATRLHSSCTLVGTQRCYVFVGCRCGSRQHKAVGQSLIDFSYIMN
jgi:hypothetical protein